MSIQRIYGVLLQELFVTKRSVEVIVDTFYFSLITVVVYGFFSLFISGQLNSTSSHYLIVGILLWEIVRVTQYTVSVGSLWNIWARNLSNMFVTPVTLAEYMAAHMVSGAVKGLFVFCLVSVLSVYLYDFNIFRIGFLNLVLFYVNLILFAWSVGIFTLGLIFRFGSRIQALAWSIIYLFQPLTANLFPVSVLPKPLAQFAYILPPTHIFEAARQALQDPSVNWNSIGIAFGENLIFFSLCAFAFRYLFNKSKETGQFVRNEG